MKEARIISLVPSATEIVCALGLKNHIVGRSHECDFPLDLVNIPVCTSTAIDSSFSSAKIDEQVRFHLIEGLSLFHLDIDLIASLDPDLIITQSQCGLCAIDYEEIKKHFPQNNKSQLNVVSLTATDIDSIFLDIKTIAKALNVSDKGDSLITELKNALSSLSNQIPFRPHQVKILCLEWLEPLMAAGNWIPSLVELAKGENLFSLAGKPSPWINKKELLDGNPDLIIIMACGFNIERTRKEWDSFSINEPFKGVKALTHNQIFIVDANHFFVRPGPRIVDSLRILCEIIYPEEFTGTYKGTGWQAL